MERAALGAFNNRSEWPKLLSGVPQVFPEGHVLVDRYVIEARLADGAMGTVYRARHVKFGRQFAIKVLHPSLVANEKVLRRFEREAELAGRLRHTNVASVVDVGVTENGLHFTAMEFASGVNLASMLAEGALTEVRMLDIAKQLCSGLQHAHEVGLIHRDFKPENVIVDQLAGGREVARIVDWGVAILLEHAGDTDDPDRLTTKGIVVGTPHYMAPEQARGGAMDHRVDMFALGLICYEMLTGLLPFDGSGVDIARANLQSPTPPMIERAPNVRVDPVLEAIVRQLLEKDPDARPPSGNAARELFELYERDRASCALLLGVDIPVEDRRTVAVEELPESELADEPDDAPHQPRDPERERITEEVRADNHRRTTAVAIACAAALALVLWLGLRGGAHPEAAPVINIDAGEQLAIVEIAQVPKPVEVPSEVPIDVPVAPPEHAIAPGKPPAKKPGMTGGGSGNGSNPPPAADAPTASDVAKLYGTTGRELKALEAKKGMDSTIELWPRYRWIRINEWITTAERRTQVIQILERLRLDIKAGH